MTQKLRAILLVLVLPAFLAGCTDGGEDDAADPTPTPTATPTDNTTSGVYNEAFQLRGAYPVTIAYVPASVTVPANTTINIAFLNNDQNPVPNHDWVLEGYEENASTEVVANGEDTSVTFEAPPPGTYAFYCSVPGHRDNGMEGTFTVE